MARHVPTKEQRSAVTVMAGLGTPPAIIAGGLNITVETLAKVYAKEIANGPDAVRLEAMKQLFNAAKTDGAGRVTAAVKLLDLLVGGDDKIDPGAVRKSDLPPRLLVFHPGRPNLYEGDEMVQVYDQNGTVVLPVSEDDDAL